MAVLDGLRDKILGGGGGSGQAALLQGVLDMLGQGGASGLGVEQLQQLAAKAGLSPEVAGPMLAKILPGIVDKLTPNGTIPDGGVLAQSLHHLKSKLT